MEADKLTDSQNKLLVEISKDFDRYRVNNLWIKNKDAEIIPFEPNIAQRALIDRVLECLAAGIPIRIIILKARQMGLSTAVEALIYWWTTTHKNITAMIVGHEDRSSKNLYNMFKRYYDNCNPLFKPTRKYDTKTDLTFSKEDIDGNQIGLNSVIKTATARNTSAGRSDTIQLLHGSEIGEWENGEDLIASLLQTVPVRPNTMIFLESTAKGIGNFFHKQWKASVKGDTPFEPFFFPWWIQDEYEMDGKVEDYTEEELSIIEYMNEGTPIGGRLFKITDRRRIERKILFRRYKEKEFAADPRKLYQEYPSTPHEAFVGAGRAVFDTKALLSMERLCADNLPTHYELVQAPDRTISPVLSPDSPLKVWDLPKRGEDYVIGADVAEGLKEGDFSVAEVIRVSDMKTVARWRGHIDPDLFGNQLDLLGRFYNFALIGVEINNHGLSVVQRLRDLFYTKLYRREKGIDERFEEPTSKLGWQTNIKTKPLAIDALAEAIRDRHIVDYDPVFIEEAQGYVRDDAGRTNAQEGDHDDTVMAKAIALQMFEWTTNNKSDLKVVKPNKMTSRKNKHKVLR